VFGRAALAEWPSKRGYGIKRCWKQQLEVGFLLKDADDVHGGTRLSPILCIIFRCMIGHHWRRLLSPPHFIISITSWSDGAFISSRPFVSGDAAAREDAHDDAAAAMSLFNAQHDGAFQVKAAAAEAEAAANKAYAMPVALELLKRHQRHNHYQLQQQQQQQELHIGVQGREAHDDRGACVYTGNLANVARHTSLVSHQCRCHHYHQPAAFAICPLAHRKCRRCHCRKPSGPSFT
jgi:hypothetical protein